MNLSLVSELVSFLITTGLLLSGQFATLWQWAIYLTSSPSNPLTYIHGLTESSSIRGVYFLGLTTILDYIISLPFTVYKTCGVEAQYGFNKTTVGLFIRD